MQGSLLFRKKKKGSKTEEPNASDSTVSKRLTKKTDGSVTIGRQLPMFSTSAASSSQFNTSERQGSTRNSSRPRGGSMLGRLGFNTTKKKKYNLNDIQDYDESEQPETLTMLEDNIEIEQKSMLFKTQLKAASERNLGAEYGSSIVKRKNNKLFIDDSYSTVGDTCLSDSGSMEDINMEDDEANSKELTESFLAHNKIDFTSAKEQESLTSLQRIAKTDFDRFDPDDVDV